MDKHLARTSKFAESAIARFENVIATDFEGKVIAQGWRQLWSEGIFVSQKQLGLKVGRLSFKGTNDSKDRPRECRRHARRG